MSQKVRGQSVAREDLIHELRRLLDQADPQIGILTKGLGSDGTITVGMDPYHVFRITVQVVRPDYPSM